MNEGLYYLEVWVSADGDVSYRQKVLGNIATMKNHLIKKSGCVDE